MKERRLHFGGRLDQRVMRFEERTMNIEQQALALYEAPFHYYRGYIWDAKNNMVADDDAQDVALRVRGWGRISYMPEAEKLQDTIGELIAKAMTEYWQTHNVKVSGARDDAR